MKKILMGLLALAAMSVAAVADVWDDDYAKAMEKAKQEGKYVLLDFTGSDWCGWCKRLDAEVFSKNAFKTFAKENLICVTIDFPRSKPQSKKTVAQNEELSAKFGVGGYPTIILLDQDGNSVGVTGYKPGGPGPYVAELKAMIDQDRAKNAPK